MEKFIEGNCKGCYMRLSGKICGIIHQFLDRVTDYDICPCRMCIVKVTCNGVCADYSVFYEDIKFNRRGT